MNKYIKKAIVLLLITTLLTTSCSSTKSSTVTSTEAQSSSTSTDMDTNSDNSSSVDTTCAVTVSTGDYSEKAIEATWSENNSSKIVCNGNSIQCDDTDNVEISGTVITIKNSGTYIFSGTLSDGQIIINASEDDNVQVVFNQFSITSNTDAAVYAKEAKNVFLTLAENTTNSVSDGSTRSSDESADICTAAIYSKTDLIINGTGTLTVNGNYKDGIVSKDDLEIIDGTYSIQAVDDGIVGKDSVCIRTGTFDLSVKGDAIKATNDEDTTKGYVIIDGGSYTIEAGSDGIEAITLLQINNGSLQISNSYEGLEAQNITINNGEINIISSDDGINICGIKTESSEESGTEMQNASDPFGDTTSGILNISGGTITIHADGDGLDSNGSMEISGGTILVYTPTNNGNAPLDYNNTCDVTGGTLIIAGGSDMAQAPSDTSSQTSAATTFSSSISANTTVTLTDSSGNEICTFTPDKDFTFALVSSADLNTGDSYTFTAGENTSTVTAGDYSNIQTSMQHMGGGRGNQNEGLRNNSDSTDSNNMN